MEIQIDLRIAAQARRCRKQLACLSGDLESLCKVKDIRVDALYLVEGMEKQGCGYQVRFGHGDVVCLCPVRREICKRYGI
jgi:pentatricopeptide repeat protein